MLDPIDIINKLNDTLNEIIKEEKLKNYYDGDINVFKLYCSDFCLFLLDFFPSATVMIKKDSLSCALLINGKLYDYRGLITDLENYYIAKSEDVNKIKNEFRELSDHVCKKMYEKIGDIKSNDSHAYLLRKNKSYLC